MIYEDFIYLWLAFLIDAFIPFHKPLFSPLVCIFWFLIKEPLFILSLSIFKKRIFFGSIKKTILVQRVFIFLVFIFYILDLYIFGLKKVFSHLLFPYLFSIFWFLHYYILVRVFLFRLSSGYIKIILGMLMPFFLLVVCEEILNLLNLEFPGDFLIVLGLIIVLGPFFMVKVWPMEELKDMGLREIIEDFLKKQKVKIQKIYVLSGIGKKIYTAGVVGFLPGFRYLFFSKSLLELLDIEEILAVLGHEVGHIKKKHVLFLLLLLFNLPFFLVSALFFFLVGGDYVYPGFLKFLSKTEGWVLGSIIGGFLIFSSFFYVRYIFAYFLRQFEREADLYSLRLLSNPYPLIKALLKIGRETGQLYQKSWHHYGIFERIKFLIDASRDPENSQKKVKKTKFLLFLWFLFNTISVLLIAKYVPSVIKLIEHFI